MKEIWKPIKSLNNLYEASSYGNIRSVFRITKSTSSKAKPRRIKSKILKQLNSSTGYCSVSIRLNSKKKNYLVHRLIAEAFIPTESYNYQINHKDANKKNNKLSNLEWCTCQENLNHAIKLGLTKFTRHNQIKLLDTITGKTFDSIKEASIHFNVKYNLLNQALTQRPNAVHKNSIYSRLKKISQAQ